MAGPLTLALEGIYIGESGYPTGRYERMSGYPSGSAAPPTLQQVNEAIRRSQDRLQRLATRWFVVADEVFYRYYTEYRESTVRLRRRQWGRLGQLLKVHGWCQQYI